MKTREMLKVIPLITLALLMSCSGEKRTQRQIPMMKK